MSQRTCLIPGCTTTGRVTRGYCSKHYQRLMTHGDPLAGKTHYPSPQEAFTNHTEWDDGCLVWTRSLDRNGYGTLRANGRIESVHIYAWERERGPVPPGKELDHTCWRRNCANIEHLRLTTKGPNSSNRAGANSNSSSGVRNVYKRGNKWRVLVGHKGTLHRFGTYDTIEEAAVVAEQARQELFGEFAGRG